MFRVLCYGDSNTWGYVPGTGERYDENIRWPKRLQKNLGEDYEIIEEGLRGRNVGHDFDLFPRGNLNGAKTFPQAILTHDPIDLVVIMLGCNDLDKRFDCTTKDCAKILELQYINFLRTNMTNLLHKQPQIVIVAPNVMRPPASKLKDEGVIEKSKSFNRDYKSLAKKCNCFFVSNQKLVCGSDGIHLTAKSHKYIGDTLAEMIKHISKTRQ